MLIHVVTVHRYTLWVHMCVYSTLSMCVWCDSEKEFKPAPLPVRLIYIYIPEG